jgi:hypothetical protein
MHGHEPEYTAYLKDPQFPKDSNSTIHVIRDSIRRHVGPLPPVLFLQLDNATSENKNRYVAAFLAQLVQDGVFKKIIVNFLPVGHTHEDIDQMFSRVSVYIKKHNAETPSRLIDCINSSVNFKKSVVSRGPDGKETITKRTCKLNTVMITEIADYKEWVTPFIPRDIHNITKPHSIEFSRDLSGKARFRSKMNMSDKVFLPSEGYQFFKTNRDLPKTKPFLQTPHCYDVAPMRALLRTLGNQLKRCYHSEWETVLEGFERNASKRCMLCADIKDQIGKLSQRKDDTNVEINRKKREKWALRKQLRVHISECTDPSLHVRSGFVLPEPLYLRHVSDDDDEPVLSTVANAPESEAKSAPMHRGSIVAVNEPSAESIAAAQEIADAYHHCEEKLAPMVRGRGEREAGIAEEKAGGGAVMEVGDIIVIVAKIEAPNVLPFFLAELKRIDGEDLHCEYLDPPNSQLLKSIYTRWRLAELDGNPYTVTLSQATHNYPFFYKPKDIFTGSSMNVRRVGGTIRSDVLKQIGAHESFAYEYVQPKYR